MSISQNLYNVTIQQLYIFINAVETNSFTKTAEMLHMTQSAVSKNMEKLEERMDLQLFTRDHKNLYLTEAGSDLYKAVKALILPFSKSYDTVWSLQHEQKNILHIGIVYNTDLEQYFWPMWTKYQNRFPEIQAEFDSDSLSSMVNKLLSGEADLIMVPDFLAGRLEREHLAWKWMARSNAVIVLPKGHPLEKKTITIDLLKDEKIVLLSGEDTNNLKHMENLFAERGFQLKVGKLYSTPDNICRFYKGSDGVLVTDRFFDCSKIHEKIVKKTCKDIEAGIIVAWNPKNQNEYIRHFIKNIPE